MTFDDFTRIDRIFARALELPPAEREQFLAVECSGDPEIEAQVRALLAAEEEGSFPAAGGLRGATAKQLAQRMMDLDEERVVGRYQIEEEIGRGGMATVFRARRIDQVFDQEVALKILRPTALRHSYEQRFQQERQILARLRHPNIAQIYDGGTTEAGSPYFAMELVDGLPLDEYCRRHQLDVEARVELVLQIVDALRAAHRQLIVHRDLKPSNVLVDDEGRVKLLDFGIAKVLEEAGPSTHETGALVRFLTPQYASPEQLKGEPVSTSTDVYQTGGLLYVLLSGQLPYDLSGSSSAAEIEQVVCDEIPERPSEVVGRIAHSDNGGQAVDVYPGGQERWARSLRGDLDAIVMKALRKDPEHRYESIDQLGEDLARHLEGRAVLARGEHWRYLTGRWVASPSRSRSRRHGAAGLRAHDDLARATLGRAA